MLTNGKKERIINSIGIAENAKLEGISATSRRILNAGENQSLFDVISDGYREFDNEAKTESPVMGNIKKFGFTVTLPCTLLIGFVSKLGGDIKTLAAIAKEEANIATLVSNGVITQEEVPGLIGKISQLEGSEKVYAADSVETGGLAR